MDEEQHQIYAAVPSDDGETHSHGHQENAGYRPRLTPASSLTVASPIKARPSAASEADLPGPTVQQVADYFLRRVEYDAGDTMTSPRLQKLMYYAQAWHLAITGQPLFQEDFEAWTHGPALPGLYRKYKVYGYNPLPSPAPDEPLFTMAAQTEDILDDVWNVYSQFSAKGLENLTHSEAPWQAARIGCAPGERCIAPISKEDMRAYYGAQVIGS